MSYLKTQSWFRKKTKSRPNRAFLWNDTWKEGVLVLWPCTTESFHEEYRRFNQNTRIRNKDLGGICSARFVSYDGWHCIAFSKSIPEVGTIAHESLHFANHILDYKGVKGDPDNDEAHAYTVQWAVERIYELTRK